MEQSAFTLTVRPDHVGIITIDVVGESINVLKAAFAGQIRDVIRQALAHPGLAGLVLISGKPDSFIAGADLHMIAGCRSAAEAENLAQQGQKVMSEIAALPVPVVAAIHGACLGGGLELAMACHLRVCSADEKTVLGLPEVRLGLLPGSGGTQRLPRLIGIAKALEMILTGKNVHPRQAVKCGLVSESVPKAILLETAVSMALKARVARKQLPLRERLMSGAWARKLLFTLVKRRTYAKTRGNYPAADKILQVMQHGLEQGRRSGYEAEARAFGELVMTPESAALRALFFATTELKKDEGAGGAFRTLRTAGVLGGGLMGGGIACITATRAGLPVRIKDISEQGVNHALKSSWDNLSRRVKRGQITAAERQQQMARISGTTHYSGFSQRDIVIEAVFEDLALKRQMVADVERYCKPDTLFASNTSSLAIADIASEAQRPENIVGLHYFSPPEKMPLVEVIPHQHTSQQTVATALSLAKKQGKIAIVVADSAGFYVNRVLAPYMIEALHCLLAGESVKAIDTALVDFGFPVGPFQLLDEIGIDTAAHIMPVLQKAWGERFSMPVSLTALLNDNRKGRKNGRGFYRYAQTKWSRKKADPDVRQLWQITTKVCLSANDITTRCVMMMLNETARTLEERVISCARDGDVGAVFGIGFPPFLGGPFRYMDRLGIAQVIHTLERLERDFGTRFTPCEQLKKMHLAQKSFYGADDTAS